MRDGGSGAGGAAVFSYLGACGGDDRAHDGCGGLSGMMRVPERPEISSATLAFAGNEETRAETRGRRKDGIEKSYTARRSR